MIFQKIKKKYGEQAAKRIKESSDHQEAGNFEAMANLVGNFEF